MSLNKTALKASLLAFFNSMDTAAKTNDQLAEAFANAVDIFVKSGTVSTTVTVVDPISGTLTGTGTGTVS